MANAGKMDRRVQFQRATITDDGFSSVETFANHGSPVWASKNDVSDGEKWRADQVSAVISARFQVRYSTFTAALTPADRLVYGGTTYDISGIKEIEGRKRIFEITAAARAD
jgi:SPP1 family predicted phage head-tail adaptor